MREEILRETCVAQYTKKENWKKTRVAACRGLLEVRLTNSNDRELVLAKTVARCSAKV